MNKGLEALNYLAIRYEIARANQKELDTIEKELKDKEKFEELVGIDLDLFMKTVDIKGLLEIEKQYERLENIFYQLAIKYNEEQKVLENLQKTKKTVNNSCKNGKECWAYLCENHYVDIPMPKGNETDEELDDYAIGCEFTIERILKAFEIIKRELDITGLIEDGIKLNAIQLTQEEYDLLKKVLYEKETS